MSSGPLAPRSPNANHAATISPQKPSMVTEQNQQVQQQQQHLNQQNGNDMEYHRQLLQERLKAEKENDEKSNQYISPSDAIMSPASKKLSELKGRHMGKAKPTSLFARTTSKNHVSSLEDAAGDVVKKA